MGSPLRIPLAIVIIASAGCASSPPSGPSATATADVAAKAAANLWFRIEGRSPAASRSVRATAVIDGFRVHPDPGDDGVIRVFADENVVVNATDIASRPPAPQSYLVMNWGDGPNQRVGCGPCRADHTYAPGRYTLVASADNLQPSAGSGTDRSISVVVEVSSRREKPGDLAPIQPFELSSSDIAVGDTTFLLLPENLPSNVALTTFPALDCSPPGAAFADFANVVFIPPNIALPFIGVLPGTCTFSVSGTVDGRPFTQSATFTIH